MTEPIDDDYLLSFSSEQQRAATNWRANGSDRCPLCGPGHAWHGIRCASVFPAPCGCPTSFEASA